MNSAKWWVSSLFLCMFIIAGGGCATKFPPDTPDRVYKSRSLEQCSTLRFACDTGMEPFFNDEGCGCETVIPTAGGNEIPDPNLEVCTQEYNPVCGEVQPQCLRAPCPPLKQTFDNPCLAQQAKAQNVTPGACEELSNNFIKVEMPVANQVVSSPLKIKGNAVAPWFVQGIAPVEIIDAQGTLLGKGTISAPQEYEVRSAPFEFETTITFSAPLAAEGYVLFKQNPVAGQAIQEVKIPVKFTNTIACTKEYKPVCGETVVQCIKAPCPPVRQTFSNRCMAEKAGIKTITNGACENDQPVVPQNPNIPHQVSCQVSGCNNEICGSEPMRSICIYNPAYECYKQAECTQQKNGQCGWTQTEALKKCLREHQETLPPSPPHPTP